MRKTIPFMALVMFAGLATAVVGADCPPGQPCIMSGGSSNASANTFEPVEKSGSDYNASLETESMRPSSNITERVVNSSYDSANGSYSLEFDGVMEVNSACYRPDFDVSRSQSSYQVDISAQKKENKTCTQVITEIDYSFSFESTSPFTAEINQGNISETFEHPELDEESNSGSNSGSTETGSGTDSGTSNGGVISGLFNWLSGLF